MTVAKLKIKNVSIILLVFNFPCQHIIMGTSGEGNKERIRFATLWRKAGFTHRSGGQYRRQSRKHPRNIDPWEKSRRRSGFLPNLPGISGASEFRFKIEKNVDHFKGPQIHW